MRTPKSGRPPRIFFTEVTGQALQQRYRVTVIANFAKLSRADQNNLLGWTGEDIKEREPDPKSYSTHKNSMSRLYQLIRKDMPYFEERIDPRDFFRVFVVEPQQLFDRIRVQSGAFLISAFHERFESREILNMNSGTPIYDHIAWEVPSGNKRAIREELRLLTITRETLSLAQVYHALFASRLLSGIYVTLKYLFWHYNGLQWDVWYRRSDDGFLRREGLVIYIQGVIDRPELGIGLCGCAHMERTSVAAREHTGSARLSLEDASKRRPTGAGPSATQASTDYLHELIRDDRDEQMPFGAQTRRVEDGSVDPVPTSGCGTRLPRR